jgi:hypothetical protein
MSLQKSPPGGMRGVDKEKIEWEEDLKPFTRLPRAQAATPRQKVVWWIPALVSALVSVFACNAIYSSVQRSLPSTSDVQKSISSVLNPTPTALVLAPTATPDVRVTATPYVAPTNTPVPSATPRPGATPGAPAPVTGFAKGGFVKVTGGGMNFRKDPSTASNPPIRREPDGATFEIIGGPTQANDYTWWQIKSTRDGTIGWGIENLLEPTAKPASTG